MLVGAIVRIKYLPDPKDFKLFVGLVLLYIGGRLLKDLFFTKRRADAPSTEERFQQQRKRQPQIKETNSSAPGEQLSCVKVRQWTFLRIVYDFCGETFTVNAVWGMVLSLLVGMVGGVYGIGGGAIITPFLVSFFGLPVYTVAWVIFYQILAPFYPGMVIVPDWLLECACFSRQASISCLFFLRIIIVCLLNSFSAQNMGNSFPDNRGDVLG